MKKPEIGIVTDTTTSVLPEKAEFLEAESGVPVVTIHSLIKLPSGKFVPDWSLNRKNFYQNMITGPLLDTSNANPPDYLQGYERLADRGVKKIISIHSSLKLTGGMNSAKVAAELLGDKHPEMEVFHIDSKSVSIGAGLLVLGAVEGVKKGMAADEIANSLDREKENIRLLLAITDAEYLIKSAGRRLGVKGLVQAVAAAVLGITPIVTLEGKELPVVAKARSTEKLVNNELIRQVGKSGKLDKRMLVAHTNSPDTAGNLAQAVNQSELGVNVENKDIWEAGSVLAVYAGSGLRALSWLVKE
jgi:DegV family protein with EDD domain